MSQAFEEYAAQPLRPVAVALEEPKKGARECHGKGQGWQNPEQERSRENARKGTGGRERGGGVRKGLRRGMRKTERAGLPGAAHQAADLLGPSGPRTVGQAALKKRRPSRPRFCGCAIAIHSEPPACGDVAEPEGSRSPGKVL